MKSKATIRNWPVIGHDWAVELLRHAASTARPPHALLITGPPNVGKGTLAVSLAQALQCTADHPPCGVCRACRLVSSRNYPDLYWIEPQGVFLRIDQVRGLTRQLALSPLEGPWQIAVLNRFELATPGAANALLKTLEEPPPRVILVLLAQQAEALLPTIVSRCQVVNLRPVSRSIIEQALIERWNVDTDQARLLSHICGGRPGWAISASTSPEMLERRNKILDALVTLLHSNRVTRFAYAEALAGQPPESILDNLELWTGWWRDVLLLSSVSQVPLTNIDRQSLLTQVANAYNIATVHAFLSALQTAVGQLARNANTRLTLEVLLLNLPRL